MSNETTTDNVEGKLQAQQDEFRKFLETTSSIVALWPEWKQSVLGGFVLTDKQKVVTLSKESSED